MLDCPEVSIVVPVAGRFEYLNRSLATLLAQPCLQGAVAAEIIVVDNARSEHIQKETEIVCVKQLERVPSAQVTFLYVRARHSNPRHRSPGFARNVGIRLARAPIVLCADADVLHVSSTAVQHLKYHSNASDVLVYGFMRDCSPSQNLTPDALRTALSDERFALRMAASTNWFGMMSFSARRERLNELGGFEEGFSRLGYEDYDLARRMLLTGTRVVRDDSIETLHQLHSRKIIEQWFMKLYAGVRQLGMVTQANIGREWGRVVQDPILLRSRSQSA